MTHPPSDLAASVRPVPAFEPEPVASGLCPTPSAAALHRPLPHRPGPHGQTARRGRRSTPLHAAGPWRVEPPAGAAAFADVALRCVLEVLDRRRPRAQLLPMLAPGLVDDIISVADDALVRSGGTATLRRVRLQAVDTDHAAAEVSASYRRAGRVRAIAGRIELFETTAGPRWRVSALHIG